MEQDPSISWSDITTPGDDEFTNFLEFNMQFPDLEGHGLPPRSISLPVSMSTSTAPPQEQLLCMDPSVTAESSSYTRIMSDFSVDITDHGQQGIPHGSSYSNAPMTPGYFAQKTQVFHNPQQQQLHQQPPAQSISNHAQPTSGPFVPQGQMMIPPTPNSVELQGSAATYPQRVDDSHDMYDRYPRMNDEQALYTPLVSPAMTPLENQFRVEYTVPGEYFTPLTSPAIEAQNGSSNGYQLHSTQISEMGFIHSPVEHAIPTSSAPSSPGLMRKHKHNRRPSTTNKIQGRLKKQQSPLVRPQTRTRTRLPEDVLNTLSQDQAVSRPANGSGLRYGSNESSGQDSVSPEPLSEPLMPPPALPPSRRSPAITPQSSHNGAAPATPSMLLMRMQRSPHSRPTSSHSMTPNHCAVPEPHDDIMEDVVLPEAATPSTQLFRPPMARIDTTVTTAPSPIIPANSTSHVDSIPAHTAKTATSIAPSPRSVAMPSPSGPVGKKSDTPKLGPMNRKRQSLSSSHPSPSLRPKISPNIQPLVNDGLSGDASALYLASKSNYQHILDGTLLPGVSYPDTLAENLSSKRTNHKLAEQGRRNRINNALKEIEALIPPAFVQMKNNKDAAASNGKSPDKEKEKAGSQPISKASTVEMAIDYIKSLKKALEESQTRLAAAEAKLISNASTTQVHDETKAMQNDEVTKPNFEETVTTDAEKMETTTVET